MHDTHGTELVAQVRSRVLARGRNDIAEQVGDSVSRLRELVHDDLGLITDDAALDKLGAQVRADLTGTGPLEELLRVPGTTDVLVNSPNEVWVERHGALQRVSLSFPGEADVRRLARRLAAAAGRRLDDSQPYCDAALPNGTRLHTVIPPLSPHTLISLRVLGRQRFPLHSLVDPMVGELLEAVVAARMAFLICGGTGTGKTTLLSAMLGRAAPSERILTIEDVPEISADHPHVVRLLSRPANIEGSGEVPLVELVRQALRMRPDRVVVGEFRGAEMVELLAALNTGHEGGACTVHANSVIDVPARLAALGALAGLPAAAVHAQAASAVDVVIGLRRAGGRRYVEAIGLLGPSVAECAVIPVWSCVDGPGPGAPELRRRLAARGIASPALLASPRHAGSS